MQSIKPGISDRKPFYGYVIVILTLVIMIAMWASYYSFGVFFKPLLSEFGWSRAVTSGAFSLTMLIQGLLGAVTGRLTDRIGPRVVMTVCGIIVGLGYLLMPLTQTVAHYYLFYGVIVGIGMGGCWVPPLSIVARWFARRRSTMTGIVAAGTGIGAIIAAPLANYIISLYDWRISYIIVGATTLVVIVIASQFLKRDPIDMGQVPYGQDELNPDHNSSSGMSLVTAMRTSQFWLFFISLVFFGIMMFALMFHLIPHASDIGISPAAAANVMAVLGVLVIAGRIFLGAAGDRFNNRLVFALSFVGLALIMFWLAIITELWQLFIFAALFGFLQGGCGVQESPLTAKLFGIKSHGVILGTVSIGFTLGGTIGPILAGYLFDISGNYQTAFIVFGVAGMLAFALALLLKPVKPQKAS
jgi:MFS family permease